MRIYVSSPPLADDTAYGYELRYGKKALRGWYVSRRLERVQEQPSLGF